MTNQKTKAMKKYTLTCFFIILYILINSDNVYSQDNKRAYHWFFGVNAGLDFSSGTPVPTNTGQIYHSGGEGTACISDNSGNLLFYTNGGGRDPSCSGGQPEGQIWDANHSVMPNGTMLGHEGGGMSSRQSSIIFPKPGSSDVYFLFTMAEVEEMTGTGICATDGFYGDRKSTRLNSSHYS